MNVRTRGVQAVLIIREMSGEGKGEIRQGQMALHYEALPQKIKQAGMPAYSKNVIVTPSLGLEKLSRRVEPVAGTGAVSFFSA
jgi:hypothetical protein